MDLFFQEAEHIIGIIIQNETLNYITVLTFDRFFFVDEKKKKNKDIVLKGPCSFQIRDVDDYDLLARALPVRIQWSSFFNYYYSSVLFHVCDLYYKLCT